MSTTPQTAVEQKLTLAGIASFRRAIYLMSAWLASNLFAFPAMVGRADAASLFTSTRTITFLFAGTAVIAAVLMELARIRKTEDTNRLLLAMVLNSAACLITPVMARLLMWFASVVLCVMGLYGICSMELDVVKLFLPEGEKRAKLILCGLTVTACAALMISFMLPGIRWLHLILSAIVFMAVLNMPNDLRYGHKLRRCLKECPDNQQLRDRLHWVFVQKHRRPWLLLVLEFFMRPIYHYRRKNPEEIHTDEENPLIYLCNHGDLYGPVACVLHIPTVVRPWSISYIMVDQEEAADYMHRYTFGPHNKLVPEPLKWPVSRLAARFSIWALNNLVESVPVFRDKPRQLMNTFRMSSDVLASGDQLLIFPENPNAVCQDHGYEHSGVGELFAGFAMIAPIYYNRTGKCARFMPMYAHQGNRTLNFGHEIVYNPDNDPTDERSRLVAAIDAEMHRLYDREEAIYQQKKKH